MKNESKKTLNLSRLQQTACRILSKHETKGVKGGAKAQQSSDFIIQDELDVI